MPLEPGEVPPQAGTTHTIDSDAVIVEGRALRDVPIIKFSANVLRQRPDGTTEVHASYTGADAIDVMTVLSQLRTERLVEIFEPLLREVCFSIAGVSNDG